MRALKIHDTDPVHESEEFRTVPQESKKTAEQGHDVTHKSACSFMDMVDGSEDTMEDDYGFFPMDDDDDDDDFEVGEPRDQRDTSHEDAASTSSSDTSSNQLASSFGSSSIGRTNRKRSTLKYGSSYGDNDEGIPLDFERNEYNRVLPKPDLSHRLSKTSSQPTKGMTRSGSRGLFRVSSEPVFVRPVYHSDEMNDTVQKKADEITNSVRSTGFIEGAMKKRISFGTINIREHAQTIGDNPSCSYGTPVQLDWDHNDLEELKVEDYEAYRPRTRTKEEFHLNHFQRINLLKLNGFSTNEIKETKRQVSKVRNQRERTKFMVMNYPQLVTVEDAIESGFRKVKRSISKSSLTSLNSKDGKGEIQKKSSKDDLSLYTSELSKSIVLDMMDRDVSNATAPF